MTRMVTRSSAHNETDHREVFAASADDDAEARATRLALVHMQKQFELMVGSVEGLEYYIDEMDRLKK